MRGVPETSSGRLSRWKRVARSLVILGWLGVAWLIWSGRLDPLLLVLGALSCLAVLWIAVRMAVVDDEAEPYHLVARALAYLPWLLWQIAVANVHIALVILSPKLRIQPQLVRVRATQQTDLGNAIFANSITLTPGTVSLDVRERTILVHALTDQSRDGLVSGEMDARVSWLERGPQNTP